MDKERIEVKKSIIVNILLIIGIVLTIWNPMIKNIQMNCLPTVMFLIIYLKKDDLAQAFLNSTILGMTAIVLDNFVPLLMIKFTMALTIWILIKLFEKKKINSILKCGLIVYMANLINGFIFSFTRPLPYFYQILTIALPRSTINALITMLILFIGNEIYEKKH